MSISTSNQCSRRGLRRAARVGIGLVGASTIAADHVLNALRAVEELDVVGVFSSSPERGAAFAERFGLVSCQSIDALLSDSAVDAVYISTNHHLHLGQAHAAIAAGKHVLCEKPIALSAPEAAGLVAAANEAGVVFATNHHFRNTPWNRHARDLVADGVIGRPVAARAMQIIQQPPDLRARRLDPSQPGAGVVWDMTVHSADTAAFVLGDEIRRATAFASNHDGAGPEDTVMGVFETAGGVPISFVDSFNSAHAGSALELHGEKASIVIAEALDELKPARMTLRREDNIETIDCGPPIDLYEYGASRFAEAIAGIGTPAASALDGARSVAVAEAVHLALRTGRIADVERIVAPHEGRGQ